MKIAHVSVGDWRTDCDSVALTCEEEGAYWRLTTYLYRRDGGLEDNDHSNADMVRVDVRVFRRLKRRLLSCGFLAVRDGMLVNHRCLEEVEAYREHKRKAADGGRKGAATRKMRTTSVPTLTELPANLGAEVPHKSAAKSAAASHENKDLAATTPSPTPSPPPSPIGISPPTTVEPLAAREGERDVGHGVLVNCETIRHRDFNISLKAIQLQLCGTVPMERIKSVAEGFAIGWAADLEAGKRVSQVVPSNTASFIRASIQSSNSKAAKFGKPLKLSRW